MHISNHPHAAWVGYLWMGQYNTQPLDIELPRSVPFVYRAIQVLDGLVVLHIRQSHGL